MPRRTVVTIPSTVSQLTTEQRDRLNQIERLLVNIQDQVIGAHAGLVGYDAVEHKLGWSGWAAAAGLGRPFDHYLVGAAAGPSGAANTTAVRLRLLDQFENTWFPRARTAIRRFVAAASRDAFEAAFFKDMSQQPEGPLVVGSTERFLTRLAGLKSSPTDGARAAYDALVKKGLTEEVQQQMAALLAEAKQESAAPPPPPAAAAEVAAATKAQQEAYEQVNLWYQDWAETLRGELPYHEQIRLGLVTPRTGRRSDPDDPATPPAPSGNE